MSDPAGNTLRFDYLRSTRPATQRQRALVFHWTAGIGDPAQVFRTLRNRKSAQCPDGLSVHYIISTGGEIMQTASLDLRCLHAGQANDWSIGVEVVCPGYPGEVAAKEAARGVAREVYRGTARGVETQMIGYTEAQYKAAIMLANHVCATKAIPRLIPRDVSREFSVKEQAEFQGVCGHMHIRGSTKQDPGPRLFERLEAAGFRRA